MKKSIKNTVLIVGDWVVDEYWFLVRHHSDISSHTGYTHYRIAGKPDTIVRDLCGAGHVARLLYALRNHDLIKPFDIVGIGQWNQKDTTFIKHLIHSREKNCPSASINFDITQTICEEDPDIELIPLRDNCPSVRVIRAYHEGEIGVEQINRVDWESEESASSSADSNSIVWNALRLPNQADVSTVIVYDLGKGAINENVIRELYKLYSGANWYVKSKDLSPFWLPIIENSVKLFLVGPEKSSLMNPWDNWLVHGKITCQALDVISSLPNVENVALLSDKREVIVKANSTNECITGKSFVELNSVTQLGWSSALFAGLIYSLLKPESRRVNDSCVKEALTIADKYSGVPTFSKDSSKSIPLIEPQIYSNKWSQEENHWQQALNGNELGLIEQNGNLVLEIWRGSTQVSGYISCIPKKREIVDEIGRSLRAFTRKGRDNKKSLSILLQADAGSGKTFLARSLAKEFDFAFISFDISQIVHREELLDMFDMIATRQVNSGNNLLVFVDEINAKVDNQQVYGMFLAPLEEGVYRRRGNAYILKPCVWVFAGTKIDQDVLEHSDKLSDYKSRMTLIRQIDYFSMCQGVKDPYQIELDARLEQVYLGASLIKRKFTDVQEVSWEVLYRFFQEDPSQSPARKIVKRVESLKNVQYGRVTRDNCSDWDDSQWPQTKNNRRLVRLVS